MSDEKQSTDLEPLGALAKFKTPDEMQVLIDKYFKEECADKIVTDKDGNTLFNRHGGIQVEYNPPTIDGLAMYLGFCSRQSLYDYEEKAGFSYTIKKARSIMADYAQKQLFAGNSTGAIFWLKNHGWKDKTEVKNDSTVKIVVASKDDKDLLDKI